MERRTVDKTVVQWAYQRALLWAVLWAGQTARPLAGKRAESSVDPWAGPMVQHWVLLTVEHSAVVMEQKTVWRMAVPLAGWMAHSKVVS